MKILAQKGMYIYIFLFFFWTFSALDYTRIAVSGSCQWDEETVTELLVLRKLLDWSTYQIHKKVCSDSHLFSLQHCSRPWTETWHIVIVWSFGFIISCVILKPQSLCVVFKCISSSVCLSLLFFLTVSISSNCPRLSSAVLGLPPVSLCFPALTCVPLVNQPPVHLSPCLLFRRVKLATMCLTSTAPHLWFPVSSYLLYFLWA